MSSKSTVTVFACGGAGINIVSAIEDSARGAQPGFADIVPVYVDTSKSNLTASHPDSRTYLIPDLDGSGKVRRENHAAIADCVNDILYRNKPTDLNIVVSSTGGGSGSVIAPSLVAELLKKGEQVIVVAVGSTDSRIEVENTIKTLQSYEVIAQRTGEPVAMIYYQNTRDQRRQVVNDKIKGEIVRLAILFSKQNRELDTTDLRNWLHYNREGVTGYDPHLVSLEVFTKVVEKPKAGHVITVATLAVDPDQSSPGMPVDYQAVGFIDQNLAPGLSMTETVHFALVDGYFPSVTKSLDAIVSELDAQKNASTQRKSIISGNVKATDNGLVL